MKIRFRCTDCEHNCTIEVKYGAGEVKSQELINWFHQVMCETFGRS